jgi:hypothetical protein
MSEPELKKRADDPPRESRKASFLRRKLAYVAVMALAVAGVAYTNVSQRPLVGYWEFLAMATGVLCVISEWENAGDTNARLRLMWTQALHWAAILITMNIVLLSAVQNMLPAPAMSLGARHLSRWSKFFVSTDLLFGACDGSRRAGDRVAQTVGTFFSSWPQCFWSDLVWHSGRARQARASRSKSGPVGKNAYARGASRGPWPYADRIGICSA